MGKLHLKETPEERAERKWRKAKRTEHKARKHRRHAETSWDDGGGGEEGWVPPASASKIDLDKIREEIEERRFREKLFGAMEEDDDARLDAIETTMNAYVHIPERWKTPSTSHDMGDPNLMTDDEYTEWIREGMWR